MRLSLEEHYVLTWDLLCLHALACHHYIKLIYLHRHGISCAIPFFSCVRSHYVHTVPIKPHGFLDIICDASIEMLAYGFLDIICDASIEMPAYGFLT